MDRRTGGCLCGQLRYELDGEPLRVGICHCHDCRRESGSAFTIFACWPRAAIRFQGQLAEHGGRGFCATCGGRLFNLSDEEAEIRAGSLDTAPTGLSPQYEIWVKRREPWLGPLPGLPQYDEDRQRG